MLQNKILKTYRINQIFSNEMFLETLFLTFSLLVYIQQFFSYKHLKINFQRHGDLKAIIIKLMKKEIYIKCLNNHIYIHSLN